jgi:hypothetical protein
MNDTPAIVNSTYRQLLNRVTGEERLRFASDSYEAAKVIVRSSFSGIEDDLLLKKKMFLRFYGNDVSEMFAKKFFEHLTLKSRQ